MEAFRELLDPIDPIEFFKEYWTKRHLHIKGDNSKYSNLFCWEDLTKILTTNYYNLNYPQVRLIMNGEILEESLVTESTDFFVGEGTKRYISPKAVHEYCSKGATLFLASVNKLNNNLQRLNEKLMNEIGERVNINAYCSYSEIKAFVSHFDRHEVIVLQIHGKKEWNIYDYTTKFPIANYPKSNPLDVPALKETITLEQGDLLYVPRGLWHDAITNDKNSLHLTIGIPCRNGIDFLKWLINELNSSEIFRENLPIHLSNSDKKLNNYGGAFMENHLKKLSTEIHEIIQDESSLDKYNKHLADINNSISSPVDFSFDFENKSATN